MQKHLQTRLQNAFRVGICAGFLISSSGICTFAQVFSEWDPIVPPTGLWHVPGNWSAGIPNAQGSPDSGLITNGYTAIIQRPVDTVNVLDVSDGTTILRDDPMSTDSGSLSADLIDVGTDGTLRIVDMGAHLSTNSFENSGNVVLRPNTTVTATNTFSQLGMNSVTTIGQGATLNATTFDLQSGTLNGNGTVSANLASSGTITPGLVSGTATGTLTIDGDVTLNSSSTLVIDVEGTDTGEFDLLDINGNVSLGGELIFDLSNAPSLEFGDTFTFLTADSSSATDFRSDKTVGSDRYYVARRSKPPDPPICIRCEEGLLLVNGDMNKDGSSDQDDIPFFVLALVDADAYKDVCMAGAEAGGYLSAYCDRGRAGDLDGLATGSLSPDNDIDFDDIDDFASAIDTPLVEVMRAIQESLSQIPEPRSFVSLFWSIACLAMHRRLVRATLTREIKGSNR